MNAIVATGARFRRTVGSVLSSERERRRRFPPPPSSSFLCSSMASSLLPPCSLARDPMFSVSRTSTRQGDGCLRILQVELPSRRKRETRAASVIAGASGYASAPTSSSASSRTLVFRDLEADDFRHPLDKQNTLLLKTVPGLKEIGKALLGPVSEQVMLLENIGTSVLVAENQLSDLHQILVEACKILNIEAPDLYIRQNPVPNAYTLAIGGRKPFIVVHTSLVELLTRKELQAVLAHELGHLKCDHGVWLSFANILTLGAYAVPGVGAFIAQRLEEQLQRWLRSAELTCDRAALLVTQDPKVVVSVLMKLAGGCPSLADQLNVDAFLEQARSYDKASSSPVGWYIRNAQTRQLSHPLPVLRAREIDEWSRSREYRSLLKRAAPP